MDAAVPNLGAWLEHVFRVLGGFILASGILTVALAGTSFREHRTSAAAAAAVAGAASIGLMSAVNFSIQSDFRWALLAMAALWASSIFMYAIEGFRASRATRHDGLAADRRLTHPVQRREV
jgi:heme A synthase